MWCLTKLFEESACRPQLLLHSPIHTCAYEDCLPGWLALQGDDVAVEDAMEGLLQVTWVVIQAWLQELLFLSLALLICLVYLLAALLLELPMHQLPAMASLLLQCVQSACGS